LQQRRRHRIFTSCCHTRAGHLLSARSGTSQPDRRRFEGNETWQAEALDPRDLAAIVQTAIDQRIDQAVYEAVLAAEDELRQDVLSRPEGLGR
jgi:hypothetical protein